MQITLDRGRTPDQLAALGEAVTRSARVDRAPGIIRVVVSGAAVDRLSTLELTALPA